ncbi:hypothetical protein VTO42DRAFT_1437 [Malbranchea cinnamomea]
MVDAHTNATVIPFTFDLPTLLSLATPLSLLPLAFLSSIRLIPPSQTRNRILFFWHAFDALTHFVMEGSFLYHCFFSYTTITDASIINARPKPFFLNRADRLYGSRYGVGGTARMWQEYGKADARWLEADLTVISLELLTVFLCGPVGMYICYLVYKASSAPSSSSSANAAASTKYMARVWILVIGLAVAEIYGGWMTFAPEWLSGSTALVTSDPIYLWLYLVFFNGLWVIVPIWMLFLGWKEVNQAFVGAPAAQAGINGKKQQ